MTKPAGPAPAAGGEVVEIDAMDGMEWEQGQHTPQANDANLAALVKETASAPEPAVPEPPHTTPLKTRGRVTASVIPQRPRASDTATQPAQPAARSTLPADVARAGSPAVELAASSAGMTAFDPTPELASSTDMEAFGPTKEYATSSAGPQVLAPAVEPAVSSAGMAPLPRLFDDATHDGPRRVDPSRAAPGSPPSLNDILRAPPRPVWADSSTAPAMLPLHAPAKTARNPAPLLVREPVPPPSEAPATSVPGGQLGSAAWRRLVLVIGGTAGCAVLVIALVVMTGGKPDEHPTPPPVDDHVQGPAVAAPAVAAPAVAAPAVAAPVAPPARSVAAPARPAELPDPEPPARRVPLALAPASKHGPVAASEPRRRSARKLGGKKLVVDYSTRTSEPAMPGLVAQPAEEPAIGLARTAYLSGNQQLFAGDAEGAIRAYRESLSLYPGYVGGYRGLGLAYAQLGDSQNALDAFKMYVGTVPNAKDVALIKKRIARLQGR